jgi:RHS repeat-associated protein
MFVDKAGTSAAVLDDNDFYPWGGVIPGVGKTTSNNTVKFTGKYRDTESGLDYFGARYYANAMGRFMSPDWSAKPVTVPYAKFGDPQSLNLYSYVRNHPITQFDPNGHVLSGWTSAGDTWMPTGGNGGVNDGGLDASAWDDPMMEISDDVVPNADTSFGMGGDPHNDGAGDPLDDISREGPPRPVIESGVRRNGPKWDPFGWNKKELHNQYYQDDKKIYDLAASIATDPMKYGGSPAFPYMAQIFELEPYVLLLDKFLQGEELLATIESIPGIKEGIGNAGENNANKVLDATYGNIEDVVETVRDQYNAQIDALISQASQAITASILP